MSSEARRQRLTGRGRRTATATITARPRPRPRPHPPRADATSCTKYVFSHDHKVIGIQFLFSGLIFFVLGGLLAMAVRWQLAWPWKPVPILSQALWSDPSLGYRMPPEFYNKLFTMHATIMIFFVIIPLLTGAFGNFLIPLMIGARDMAFPKLNMFSYWFMPAGVRRSSSTRSSSRGARPRRAGRATRSSRSPAGRRPARSTGRRSG